MWFWMINSYITKIEAQNQRGKKYKVGVIEKNTSLQRDSDIENIISTYYF